MLEGDGIDDAPMCGGKFLTDFTDFDRYCDEHSIVAGDEPIAFAAWLHEITNGEWDGDAERVN